MTYQPIQAQLSFKASNYLRDTALFLFEQSSDALIIVDQQANIQAINQTASQLFTAEIQQNQVLLSNIFLPSYASGKQVNFKDLAKEEMLISVIPGKASPFWQFIQAIPLENSLRLLQFQSKSVEANHPQLQWYTQLLQHTNDGVVLVDAQNKELPIVFANKAFLEITGYEFAEIEGRNCRFLQGSQTSKKTIDDIRKAIKAKEAIDCEILNYKKNGTPFWNQLSIIPLFNADGLLLYYTGIQKDVTAEKQYAKSLKRKEKQYKELIENLQAAVLVYSANGHLVFANKLAIKLFDLQENESGHYHLPTFKYVREVNGELIHNNWDFEQISNKQITINNQVTGIHLPFKKELNWVIMNAYPHYDDKQNLDQIIVSFFDINEQKNAEKKIEDERTLLKTLINTLPDAIYVKDTKARKLIANSIDVSFIGKQYEAETLGKTDIELFGDKGLTGLNDDMLVINKGVSIVNKEEFFENVNGKKLWLLTSKVPLKNNDGEIVGLVGIGRDITERKLIEDQIIREKNRLNTLINSLPDAVYIKDNQARKIICNHVDLSILGAENEASILGKTDLELFANNQGLRGFQDDMYVLQTGKSIINKEQDLIDNTGKHRWMLTSKVPIFDEQNTVIGLVGIGRDITERKYIQEALTKSQTNLQTILANTQVGYVLLNKRFQIISFNQKAQIFAQADLKQTLEEGKYVPAYFTGDQKEFIKLQLNNALDKQIFECEISYPQPNDNNTWYKFSIYPVENDNKEVNGLMLSVENITERKLTEIQLNKTLKEITDYKLALDESSIVLITDEKGIITYTNENFAKASGYSSTELIGFNCNTVNSGYHPKAFFKELWSTITAGKAWKGEIRNKRKDGNYYWVDTTIIPFLDKTGKPYQYISIRTDITERKNAELELQKSFNMLSEQNNRLKNFSYIVSHNLRSHTSNIKSIINILGLIDNEEEKLALIGHLSTVTGLLDETLYNLNEVVAIQNNQQLQLIDIPINDYISKTIDVLKEQITKKEATIEINIPPKSSVKSYPAYLESILINLLSNALKYASPDRKPIIKINFTNVNLEPWRYCLQVSDNGMGINMDRYADKIFGMYKTFHGNKDARGIGLFITKNQVEALGGKIEISSELNKGTTFSVYFT
ncbi:MAG: PAS domain S-box protein [Chitinophagaceae bacterium]